MADNYATKMKQTQINCMLDVTVGKLSCMTLSLLARYCDNYKAHYVNRFAKKIQYLFTIFFK